MFDYSPGYLPPEPEPDPRPRKRASDADAARRRRRRLSRIAVFGLVALGQLSPLIAVLAGVGWALIEAG